MSSSPIDFNGAIFLYDTYISDMDLHHFYGVDGVWDSIGCYTAVTPPWERLQHHPISALAPGAVMLALQFWSTHIPLSLTWC